MDDFLKDLKFHVYDRLRSPIITAFTLSWVTWNFSTILLLFGKGDFEKKIFMLSKIYSSKWSYFLNGLLFPMAWATAFILIYPFLARWAFLYWGMQLKTTKEKQAKMEDNIPMTLDDIRELKRTFYERSKSQEDEIERLQVINQQLRSKEKDVESIVSGYIEREIEKEKALKLKDADLLILSEALTKAELEVESITKQFNSLKTETKAIQSTTRLLGNKSSETGLKRFLSELKVDDLKLTEIDKRNLTLVKDFMDKFKLNLDEIKAILFLLQVGGRAYLAEIRNYLNLSNINFDVVIKRLSNNGYCEVHSGEIVLKTDTTHKLYESKLSKIDDVGLKDLINLLSVE